MSQLECQQSWIDRRHAGAHAGGTDRGGTHGMLLLGPGAALLLLASAACGGSSSGQSGDAGTGADAALTDGGVRTDGADLDAADAALVDGAVGDGAVAADAGAPDAGFDGVIGVVITVADTCEVDLQPASITVPVGTEFTVDWIHAAGSASPVDVDKIDNFNQVPIVIDLPPGDSYHDDIRAWCGDLFTGTFAFRVTGCFEPAYLDVDCGG